MDENLYHTTIGNYSTGGRARNLKFKYKLSPSNDYALCMYKERRIYFVIQNVATFKHNNKCSKSLYEGLLLLVILRKSLRKLERETYFALGHMHLTSKAIGEE